MSKSALRFALAWLVLLVAAVPQAASAIAPARAHRVPPVHVAGAPRSLVTLAVPVPAQLAAGGDVTYRVERTGYAELLGRLEGTVMPGAGSRQVMLTLRVPADARVGLLDVADVEFTAPDGSVIIVPIILRVPAVRVLRLQAPPPHFQLRQGDRLELTFVVRNLGNAPERATVSFTPPPGWPLRGDEQVVVPVGPFEDREVRVRLLVPAHADGGEFLFAASAVATADADSTGTTTATTRLNVLMPEARAPGLRMTSFVAGATGLGSTSLATGIGLSGPLTDGVHMDVRLLPFATASGAAGVGLTGGGSAALPLQASLQGQGWRASLGSASTRISDLTGVNITGVGVHTVVENDRYEGQLLVSRPFEGVGLEGQHFAASGRVQTRFGRIGGSLSSLRETTEGFSGRELTAVGADWSPTLAEGWTMDLGVAARSYFEETGLGARAFVAYESDAGRASLRMAHAPGGSRAFASGVQQLELNAERRIAGRWTTGVSATGFRDEGPVLGEVRTQMLTQYNRFQLSRNVALVARGERMTSEVRAVAALGAGDFGVADHALALGAQLRAGAWSVTSELRGSDIVRRAELFSGSLNSRRAVASEVTLNASRSIGSLAQLSTGTTFAQASGNVGLPANQLRSFFDISGVRVPGLGDLVQLNSRFNHVTASAQRDLIGMQFTALARLPLGIEVAALVERNPFFRSASGGARWLTGIRVSSSTDVGMPRLLKKVTGVVFEDRNGNGQRDAGEPGIPGVILRLNGIRIVTEEGGVYRVPANARGRLQVDPLGLPRGFVMSPLYSRDFSEKRDIPLVQTGSVTVALAIAADPEGRRPNVDLSLAQVWLRDAFGFEWVGRLTQGGEVTFENVPAGRYSFRFDFSRLSEPLFPEEGAMVEVGAGVHREITATLRGRSVRLIAPPSRQGGRGGTGGSGGAGGSGRDRRNQQRMTP